MDTDPLPAIEAAATTFTTNLPLLAMSPMSGAQIVALTLAILLLFVSGFVSGSEIAYFSLTPAQCEEIEDTPKGRSILRLLGIPERLLATILIANNLVNVAIVVLCNFALGPIFEGMSAVLSFILQSVILTFLILLFGEILPKLYANSNNLGWAKMADAPLSAMVKIFHPLSSLLV